LPEAVFEVDAGLFDDGLSGGGASEESGQGQGMGEFAVGGDQVRVRGQGGPVDLGLGRDELGAVEGGEAGDDRGDEGVEIGVGQCAGDPA
jgi:hypothetical protein